MNQPKILLDGRVYEVYGVYWTDGEISHIAYNLENGELDVLWPDTTDFTFIKEDEVNA